MDPTHLYLEPCPDLSSEFHLTRSQVEDYRSAGHIVLRNIASKDEIDGYYPALRDAVESHKADTPLEERDTYGKAFIQIGNIWLKSEAMKRFTLARRFAKIAADLMGVEGVRLYHDQALWKEPGGGHTPWHQDQFYWPLATDNTITMWMPFVDISAAMGPMTFVSGSHKLGYLGEIPISDDSEAYYSNFIDERGLHTASAGAMRAGDATFHAGWTLHGAPANLTQNMRAVMTIIYYGDGARVSEPDNPNRIVDRDAFFPGLQAGDLAVSEFTPLVYSGSIVEAG